MELHQLRYFVAVAQSASFSRAAERCDVSQPSLSQQIGKLERQLHQRLFDRLGRRVLLTDAGRLLFDRAAAILAAVDDAERWVRDANNLEGGQLTIGAIPTISPYLLPRALKRFNRRHSQVEVTVHEDVTRQLLAAIFIGDLDLALIALPVEDSRLESETLLTEPLLLALPPTHRLVHRKRISMDDIRDERFILLSEMHCLGEQVLSFCRASGCEPRIACRSVQIATVQSLIAMGQGVSLLPEMARQADTPGQTCYRRLADGKPTRTIAAVWNRHRYRSPVAEWFLTCLRESCHSRKTRA